MKKDILVALPRMESAYKTRNEGFIPGVAYGKDFENILVKLNRTSFINLLNRKGEKSKIIFKIGDKENFAIIKDVGRNIVNGEIIHVDIQVLQQEDVVKWIVPVIFTGKDKLAIDRLSLQVYCNKVKVQGQAGKIPDHIKVDLSEKKYKDKIRVGDLNIDPSIKIFNDLETILAVVVI